MKKRSVINSVIYLILASVSISCVCARGAETEASGKENLEQRVEMLEQAVMRLSQQLGEINTAANSKSKVTSREQIDELDFLSKNLDKEDKHRGWPSKKSLKKTGGAEKAYAKITELIKGKNYVKAQSESEKYIEDHPEGGNLSDVYFWLGEIKMLFGDLLESKVYYQKALELMQGKGRSSEVLLKLFVIAYQKGDKQEGDYHFEKLQKKHPESTAFHMAKLQKQKYSQGKS